MRCHYNTVGMPGSTDQTFNTVLVGLSGWCDTERGDGSVLYLLSGRLVSPHSHALTSESPLRLVASSHDGVFHAAKQSAVLFWLDFKSW